MLLTAYSQLPNTAIDVEHYHFEITLSDDNDSIHGNAEITALFKEHVKEVSLDLAGRKADGKGMLVSAVKQNGNDVGFTQEAEHIIIHAEAAKNSKATYTITYQGQPFDGLIIDKNKFNNRTFFSDNWPNRAHYWIPCNDHPSDKATVEFIITAPEHYQVVCNGLQVEETNLPGHLKLTHWKEEVAISTKIFALGVADFAVNYSGNVNCIPVYGWVYPEQKEQGFKDYARTKGILDWYIQHVGPYSFEKLANVQSKTIFGGVENAGTIFYAEKSVGDKGIESLLAHEIAHQWFGDAASETDWPHLWLSEGFATYMTHLYLESKYGIDTLKAGMAEDRKDVIKLAAKKNTPIIDTMGKYKPMKLLNANSYQKGGWVLHMLRRKLGDTLFWHGIRSYYAKYMGGNASTEDLREVFEKVSGQNLEGFFRQWLYTPGHPKLGISWQYDKKNRNVRVKVEQQQATLFEFPLELRLNGAGKSATVYVKKKIETFTIPVSSQPADLLPDPNINLLFEYNVHSTIE